MRRLAPSWHSRSGRSDLHGRREKYKIGCVCIYIYIHLSKSVPGSAPPPHKERSLCKLTDTYQETNITKSAPCRDVYIYTYICTCMTIKPYTNITSDNKEGTLATHPPPSSHGPLLFLWALSDQEAPFLGTIKAGTLLAEIYVLVRQYQEALLLGTIRPGTLLAEIYVLVRQYQEALLLETIRPGTPSLWQVTHQEPCMWQHLYAKISDNTRKRSSSSQGALRVLPFFSFFIYTYVWVLSSGFCFVPAPPPAPPGPPAPPRPKCLCRSPLPSSESGRRARGPHRRPRRHDDRLDHEKCVSRAVSGRF